MPDEKFSEEGVEYGIGFVDLYRRVLVCVLPVNNLNIGTSVVEAFEGECDLLGRIYNLEVSLYQRRVVKSPWQEVREESRAESGLEVGVRILPDRIGPWKPEPG